MRLVALFILGLASPLAAQLPVVSPAPERVGVTIYRDLNRGSERPNLTWLNGYALISETRTVTLPAGEADLRFEGVASGIVPQSAILSGLPQGIVERNRDALLLSAGSLIDRSLGQRVTLRRTDRATGKVSEEEAVIRTGSEGGVVVQTRAGVEALRCSGLSETLTFPQVPPGLSAKPTLSVRVRSAQPLTATVTLSYLATGFDWNADYVGILSPDERSLKLQAWLTLASTDDTSFRNATAQAVAGRVNREEAQVPPAVAPPIQLSCWPEGSTSDGSQPLADGAPPPPPPPPPPPAMMAAQASEIVVTGSRIMSQRERLGDLQLYRFPEPVTIAANAQKQVGLIDQPEVKVRTVYRFRFAAEEEQEGLATPVLRTANRMAEGLGLPLPAGRLVLFREGARRPLLVGETELADRTIGEKVELQFSEAPGVRGRLTAQGKDQPYVLTLSNDRDGPVEAEVILDVAEGKRLSAEGKRLVRRDGQLLWIATVPANGRAELRYRVKG
jgi:hypothetical protein